MSHCRIVSLVVITALTVVSCAPVQQNQDDLPNRTFSTLAIVSPREIVEVVTPETGTERMLEGASAGSTGVGLGGAVVGAAACGPFLYGLCVFGLGMAGMMAGGIGGAFYGVTGMSTEDAALLELRMGKLMLARDLQSELIDTLRVQLPAAMLAKPDVADVQLIISFERFEFSKSGDAVRLEAKVRLQYATDGSERRLEEGFRAFKVRSGEARLDDLRSPDSPALASAIDDCIAGAAKEIEVLLHEHWQPQDSPGLICG